MPKGDLHNSKTSIKVSENALDIYERMDSPDSVSAILGELLSIRTGRPKPGLKSWKLKQRTGLSYDEYREALDFMDSNGMLNAS